MATATEAPERIDLALQGMTCASCAGRIERKLNKLEGVQATVNYATEQAAVSYDPTQVEVTDLIHAVEAAGYRARNAAEVQEEENRARTLAVRLLAAAILTTPLTVVTMIQPTSSPAGSGSRRRSRRRSSSGPASVSTGPRCSISATCRRRWTR